MSEKNLVRDGPRPTPLPTHARAREKIHTYSAGRGPLRTKAFTLTISSTTDHPELIEVRLRNWLTLGHGAGSAIFPSE